MYLLKETNFNFPNQKSFYKGKVRDVYNINDDYLVVIVSDRISAFDVVLPKAIPYKGEILNRIANMFLDQTKDIIPNWKLSSPLPMITIGLKCNPFPIEMIVRGYLTGSAWRLYKSGGREICGVILPEGMKENQKFDTPIITPTTKADIGKHDENISKDEIIKTGLMSKSDYEKLENYSLQLFQRGTEIAKNRGLILVDTKYEFGKRGDSIYLIDEIHTPDSSRYFYQKYYQKNFENGVPQEQLSKEFVREWLMDNGFEGKEGQRLPELTESKINDISMKYQKLYNEIIGEKFLPYEFNSDVEKTIEKSVIDSLSRL